jgi:hypothetical protein
MLWVESGRPWLPDVEDLAGRPTAAWLIDTHRGTKWRGRLAAGFDTTFVAQRGAVDDVSARAGRPARWLPLAVDRDACDPGRQLDERRWDVAFVGAAPTGSFRAALLGALAERVAVAPWSAYVPPDEMMQRYRDARVVLNVPVADDLNMRAFEASGARARLVTGPMDALEAVLPEGTAEIVPVREIDRWVEAVLRTLEDPEGQDKADAAHRAVTRGHTYHHRAEAVADALDAITPSVTDTQRAAAFAAAYTRWGQTRGLARLGLKPLARARWTAGSIGWSASTWVKRRLGRGALGTTRF